MRAFQQSYISSPTTAKRRHLFDTLNKLSSRVALLEIDNIGLKASIQLQKKKNKKARRLNLAGEESSKAECWSPAKVAKARVYQDQQVQIEVEEQKRKEAKKAQRAINAEIKADIQAQREAASQLKKDLKATITPKLHPTQKGSRTTKTPAKTILLASPKVSMPSKLSQTIVVQLPIASEAVKLIHEAREGSESRSGVKRNTRLPRRYQD